MPQDNQLNQSALHAAVEVIVRAAADTGHVVEAESVADQLVADLGPQRTRQEIVQMLEMELLRHRGSSAEFGPGNQK